MIARRTRLSFLNSEAALEALPTVIDIMSKELGWDRERQDKEFRDATKFLTSMGLSWKRLEGLTLQDVRDGRHRKVLAVDDDCACPSLSVVSFWLSVFFGFKPLIHPHPADLARTVFSPDELKTLRKRFAKIDGAFSLNSHGLCASLIASPCARSRPRRPDRCRRLAQDHEEDGLRSGRRADRAERPPRSRR